MARPELIYSMLQMMRQGASDDQVLAAFRTPTSYDVNLRQSLRIARDRFERFGGLRRHGPWPVSYVRNDGERVFRVGPGHDIPERSLGAFGFVLPEGA